MNLTEALEALDRGQLAELRSHWLEMHLCGPTEFAGVFGELVDAVDLAESKELLIIHHAEQQFAGAGTANGSSESSVT